ncbi:MAG: hypothetical protein Q8R96_21165 [Bacteroidota bacterium]|nr:hypothetical protein [Bacteroidota bacterium]
MGKERKALHTTIRKISIGKPPGRFIMAFTSSWKDQACSKSR